MTGIHCSATRADGSPCRAWAVRGTDPPRCGVHGGTDARIGPPLGNTNALKHGYYARPSTLSAASPDGDAGEELCTIDDVIFSLHQKQKLLDAYIDEVVSNQSASVANIAHLLRLQGQNASRLGRLLRDRRALSGDAADGISGAIGQALDELSTELGIPL